MKVFVSSTFIDLVIYRKAVAEALERLGLELGRMEAFGARPQDPMEVCLTEIEASELFVGVYAHRYGFIPTNSTFSITELEFDHATFHRRPTFCFFLDETFPWEADYIEIGDQQLRLNNFKAKVGKLVVRDTFTTPDVLASRVVSSIGRYLLSDPRRGRASKIDQSTLLSLMDAVAMVFVDLMRLACVAGIDSARAVNQARYNEFVDIADLHFSDFRLQVARLLNGENHDNSKKCDDLDRALSWAIVRLRRGPAIDRNWLEFIKILYDISEKVNVLCNFVDQNYYLASIDQVSSEVQMRMRKISSETLRNFPEVFYRHRLSTQQDVIDKMKINKEFTIATIRDDISRKLAIPYYYIDLILLRAIFNEAG